MSFILQPWQLLVVCLAGWVNQQRQQIIDFQRTEIDVLKEKLGKKRIILNDDRRRRLAEKGKVLGRKVLEEIGTRRVHFAGCTPNPDEPWMQQIARNLTDVEDGFLLGKRYVLMDRDGKFCPAFQAILKTEGVEPVLLPARSPNLNSHLERFHGSLKSECLDRMIFFGETSLRNAVREFLVHYHQERNHQGLGNRILEPGDEVGQTTGEIECRERLGGLLRYYRRAA